MSGTALSTASANTRDRAEYGSSPRQQIDAPQGWLEAEGHEAPVRQLGEEPRGSGRSPGDV